MAVVPKIPCFASVKIPDLEGKFNSRYKEGMSEKEQREIGTEIALEYHKQLHKELVNFKEKDLKMKLTAEQKKYVSPDKSKRIKEIEDEYQAKINEANTPIPEQKPSKEESGVVEDVKTEGEGTGKPPPDKPKVEPVEGDGSVRLTHADTEQIYKEAGLPERLTTPTKHNTELEAQAEQAIKDGYNFKEVAEKVMKGEYNFEDIDQVAFAKRVGALKAKQGGLDIKSEEFDKLQTEIETLSRASDVAGTIWGRAGQARKVYVPKEESLADYVMVEKEINQDAPLTDKQKETIQKEYNDIKKAKQDFDEYMAQKEAGFAKQQAEAALKKQSGQKNPKRDYAAERQQIFTDIREKLRKARGETSATFVPYAKELIAIAPDVAKLVKNLVDNGVTKLADVVKEVHGFLKDEIKGINEKDIHDIIAGEYNEKKQTRNELAKKLYDLKQEAILINKYEKLQSGIEPKREKDKIKRNQQLEALRKQIKEHDLTKLAAYKANKRTQIEKVESQIRKGDFAPPEKRPQIKLDKEGQQLRDNLMKLQQQRDARIVLAQRMSETPTQSGMRYAAEVLNIPRTLMTIGDFSGLLRQNLFFSVGHPLMTAKNVPDMFRSFTSQKVYDRWFADLKETPRYETIQKSRLAIADALSHDLTQREEAFMSTLAEKIPIIGSSLQVGKVKVPGLNIVKGSERSYTLLLNKMRVDMFNYFADKLEARGITADNSPKVFKATAEYINNATGRSDFGGTLNRIAPILNGTFFSPRLIASRINMLTYWAQPRFWKTLPREVRIDYFRNWASLLAVGGTVMAIAALGGADVEEDPRSSDFGKIKSGNTRWDIWGGAQPYVRVMAQIITGQRKSTMSGEIYDLDGKDIFGKNRVDVVTSFFRNKLAPVPGAMVDILSGRTTNGDRIIYEWGGAEGKEISIDQYVKQRLLPMTITGTQEAIKDQGLKALFTVGIPSTFGVGTQTFSNKQSSSNTITIKDYESGKKIELTQEQQKEFEDLRDKKFEAEMKRLEKQWIHLDRFGDVIVERKGDDQDEFVEDKMGKPPVAFKNLTPDQKKQLETKIKNQMRDRAEAEITRKILGKK